MTIIFFISCSTNNSGDKDYVEVIINNSKIIETANISDRIGSVKILPLAEEKGNRIGGVYKLFALQDKYIIYDRLSINKILLFDDRGSFIKAIVKAGDSINEPLNITDCWLNENNELEVYDYAQMRIYQFDSSFILRNIVKSNSLDHFAGLRAIPKKHQYIGYANFSDFNKPFNKSSYQIAFMDSDLNIMGTDKNFNNEFRGITWTMYKTHFYKYRDTLRFVKAYDNYIYSVLIKQIKPRYKIHYKENSLPDDVLPIVKEQLEIFKDRDIDPNVKALYFKKFSRFNGLWLENDKYIFISSRDTLGKYGNSFYSLIDKNNNKELFSARNLCDTKSYKLMLPPFEFYDEIHNEFISIVNGFNLKSLLFSESYFKQRVISDPNIFYLVKVKLK